MCQKLSWIRDFENAFYLESADSNCTVVSKGRKNQNTNLRIEQSTFLGAVEIIPIFFWEYQTFKRQSIGLFSRTHGFIDSKKYQVNRQFKIWHVLANFVLMCLVSRWSGAHDRALAGIYGVEYSALDAYQLLISVNSCFIVIFWAQFSTVLFMITHPRHKLMTPPSYVWSHSVHRVRFSNVDSTSPLKSLVLFEFMLFNIQLNIHRAEL